MGNTGAIAKNFHEGTRSEYLAQYVFSAFGTSIPVPHPEDSGIDLHCTLGRVIGRRLHVSQFYYVQVKSGKEKIIYEGKESIEWLISHKYPFILCYVDKKNNKIKIYQTISLSIQHHNLLNYESVELFPDEFNDLFELDENHRKALIKLGKPILDFRISELSDNAWIKKAKEILEAWIDIDQRNINQKDIGFFTFIAPLKYETNVIFDRIGIIIRHIDNKREDINNKYLDSFLKLLSEEVYKSLEKKDKT
jgi:hypothetical protein